MKIACIQMCSGTSEAANISDLRELVGEAAAGGAQYVQSPEMTGILQRDGEALMREISPEENNPVFAACSELASRHGIWLHLGSTAIALSPTRAANRGALFSPAGKRVATYDKIHMFDVQVNETETWRESARYEAGAASPVIDTGSFSLGMAICYDLRFPHLFRAQAMAGAQMLSVPAAFTRPTGEAHWETLIRARSIENGAFVVAAAQGGRHEEGRSTHGHSMIAGPWGEIVGMLDHDRPGVLVCEIDLAKVDEARKRIPNLQNGREIETVVITAAEAAVDGSGRAGAERGAA